jgi:hypothetical protein
MTFGQASASTQMLAAATVKIFSSFHQYTGLRLASGLLSRRGSESELKLIYAVFAMREHRTSDHGSRRGAAWGPLTTTLPWCDTF